MCRSSGTVFLPISSSTELTLMDGLPSKLSDDGIETDKDGAEERGEG